MLLGNGYQSSEDESDQEPVVSISSTLVSPPNTAPDVSLEIPSSRALAIANSSSTALSLNLTSSGISGDVSGPANPYKNGTSIKRKNVPTGHAQETSISGRTFDAQRRTYENGQNAMIATHSKEDSRLIRAKRQKKGDTSIADGDGMYLGPWAKYTGDDVAYEQAEAEANRPLASDEEWVEESEEESTNGLATALPAASTGYAVSDGTTTETTELFVPERDYMGRTYMHVPQDLDIDLKKEPGSQQCFYPKRLIHEYKHHKKPITSLRFIPQSSHLLLSSAADGILALWDAHHDRSLLRTMTGHTKSITATDFSPDGTRILSASYDRLMKLWDTETGACLSRYTTGKTPHCLAFNPDTPSGHQFISGMNDKKILQWDTRISPSTSDTPKNQSPTHTEKSPALIQEYDHHLGSINSLLFVDENRRFISTSDDKSLRAWEWNIPVPIKLIADPSMFALTRGTVHPSGKSLAYQSADNQILVYSAGDKFKQNRKKGFRGMNTSGYAIDVACSPDGGLIASGDSGGYVCFWDWKNGKMLHKIQAGGGKQGGAGMAVTNLAWHGHETSKVATGGLDGVIRYWD